MVQGRITAFYGPLLLYMVGLNVILVTSVALLHEMGHAALGHWMGCQNIEIVLFSSNVQSTFSQMACTSTTDPGALLMFLSAFIFILPVAGLFLVLEPFKEKHIGFIVLGIGVMVAAADMRLFTQASGIELLMLGIGAVIAFYGEERLVNGIITTEIVPHPEYSGREAQK